MFLNLVLANLFVLPFYPLKLVSLLSIYPLICFIDKNKFSFVLCACGCQYIAALQFMAKKFSETCTGKIINFSDH